MYARASCIIRLAGEAAQPQPQPIKPCEVNIFDYWPTALQFNGDVFENVERGAEILGWREASFRTTAPKLVARGRSLACTRARTRQRRCARRRGSTAYLSRARVAPPRGS